MSAPVQVVAAVIERDGRILACRRGPGRMAAGRWEFPGGKLERGESAVAALEREIREELGVGIRVVSHLTTDDTDGIRLICLRARLTGDPPVASTDHDELRWVRPDELGGLTWADPDLPAVRLLAGPDVTSW